MAWTGMDVLAWACTANRNPLPGRALIRPAGCCQLPDTAGRPAAARTAYSRRRKKATAAGAPEEAPGAAARGRRREGGEGPPLSAPARAAGPRRPAARQRGKQPARASVQHILDSAGTAA